MDEVQLRGLIEQVINRAREDAAFREAVLADPRGAVEQEFGVSLPADLDVTGIRDRAISRFQARPASETDELSDEELDTVAGGEDKGVGDDRGEWSGCFAP